MTHDKAIRRHAAYRAVLAATLWAACAGAAWAQVATPQAAADAATARARVIVKFKSDGALAREVIASAGAEGMRAPRQAARLSMRLGLALRDGIVVAPGVQVIQGEGIGSRDLAARLAKDPDVEYAEVDERVRIKAAPNDAYYLAGPVVNLATETGGPAVGQWYLRPSGSTALAAIDAENAWNLTTGSPTVVVAVVDTGVRFDHPDLSGKLLPGYDFVSEDAAGVYISANDGDGWDADASDPGDWVTAIESRSGVLAGCEVSTSSWHGTQVSGLVAASTDNGIGMAGSGRNIRVLPVRALGKCGGYQSDIAAGMRWAAGLSVPGVPLNPNPAKVVNLSLGSEGACGSTYQAAVNDLVSRGVVVVAAAGNEDGFAVTRPANCAGAIGVAGVRHIGTKVGYSNIGPEVAIAAPAGNCGSNLFSDPCLYALITTINDGEREPANNTYSDAFNASFGTSFAAPLVSGTVGLMFSQDAGLTVAQVRAALQTTARPFPTTGSTAGTPVCQAPSSTPQLECYCTRTTCGAGLLDAHTAVSRVSGWTVAFTPTSSQVRAGATTGFDGSATSLPAGRAGVSYLWSVVDTDSGAQIVGVNNGVQVQVSTDRIGSYALTLEVTDDQGVRARATRSIKVVAGSSGGGAFDGTWLALLALAATVLSATRRRAARRA